jgi:hypothetical protein
VCAEGHVGYKNGNHADATLLPAGMKINLCSSFFCALNFAQQVEFDGGGFGFWFFFFFSLRFPPIAETNISLLVFLF